MVGVFVFLDMDLFGTDRIVLFDSEPSARQWMIGLLYERGIIRRESDDQVVMNYGEPVETEQNVFGSDQEALDEFENRLGPLEFFHIFDVEDQRSDKR